VWTPIRTPDPLTHGRSEGGGLAAEPGQLHATPAPSRARGGTDTDHFRVVARGSACSLSLATDGLGTDHVTRKRKYPTGRSPVCKVSRGSHPDLGERLNSRMLSRARVARQGPRQSIDRVAKQIEQIFHPGNSARCHIGERVSDTSFAEVIHGHPRDRPHRVGEVAGDRGVAKGN